MKVLHRKASKRFVLKSTNFNRNSIKTQAELYNVFLNHYNALADLMSDVSNTNNVITSIYDKNPLMRNQLTTHLNSLLNAHRSGLTAINKILDLFEGLPE